MNAQQAQHQRSDPSREPRCGRIRWRRFVGLLAPATVVMGLMMLGVLHGVLPVSAAVQNQQRIKIALEEVSANGYGTYPQFFRTRDGRTRPVVVVGLQQLRAQGVCASGKVNTPMGPFVVRIATKPGAPELSAADVQMAIEEINGADVAGQSLALNRGATTPEGIPTDSGPTGTLPINVKTVALSLHANLRWVTASGLNLSNIDLTSTFAGKECF